VQNPKGKRKTPSPGLGEPYAKLFYSWPGTVSAERWVCLWPQPGWPTTDVAFNLYILYFRPSSPCADASRSTPAIWQDAGRSTGQVPGHSVSRWSV